MSHIKLFAFIIFFLVLFAGTMRHDFSAEFERADETAKRIGREYFNMRPVMWGSNLSGVLNKIKTDKKIIALTLDVCGGKNGSEADTELLDFLIKNNVKATIFVNIRWIEKNEALFMKLASSPLFQIENHGLEHRPLSVNSREIYGISGTGSPSKAAFEVEAAGLVIERLTGRKPTFFRSGTAYYDDVAIKITESLGYKVAGFSIVADKGATLSSDQVQTNMLKATSGDIIIAHANRPLSGTRDGIKKAVPELIKNGFSFIKLSEAELTSSRDHQ